jgi:hypothetical protein
MFYKLRRVKDKIDRLVFDFRCKGVYKTPPVTCDPTSDFVLVSQLHHPDMTMFMLAAKSLLRYIRPKGLVLVDDGLTATDRDVLKAHFDNVIFIERREIKTEHCPSGGCWERLLTLSEVNTDSYVIQMDSDTLTLNEPTEVIDCISKKSSFTLGTSSGRSFVGFDSASEYASSAQSLHIQNLAERGLGRFPGKEKLKYVRGGAGFTGFAKGHLPRGRIQSFSKQMASLVGEERWKEWGTEQVSSNYMAANAPVSIVLPVDKYPFWMRGVDLNKAVFVHFFGTYRFQDGEYLRRGMAVIDDLLRSEAQVRKN